MVFYERAFGMQKKYVAKKEVFGEMDAEVPLQFVQEDFARGSGRRRAKQLHGSIEGDSVEGHEKGFRGSAHFARSSLS